MHHVTGVEPERPSLAARAVATRRRRTSPWALIRAILFLVEVLALLPARPLSWLTRRPKRRHVTFDWPGGTCPGRLYLPAGNGSKPGLVFYLGAAKAGPDDPRVERLADALARCGFVTLMCWSTAMQDGMVEPDDLDALVAAFEYVRGRPEVDPTRIGFASFCVGAAYSLVAAARPEIAKQTAFVIAFGPFYASRDLVRAMATNRAFSEDGSRTWRVAWEKHTDTWEQFQWALLDALEDETERGRVQDAFQRSAPQPDGLSPAASAVYQLLAGAPFEGSDALIEQLPSRLLARMDAVSPRGQLDGLRAEILVIHSASDVLIPVEESRRLVTALGTRVPVTYTEVTMFEHTEVGAATRIWTILRELTHLAVDLQVLLRYSR